MYVADIVSSAQEAPQVQQIAAISEITYSHVMLHRLTANCCYFCLQEAAKGLESGELTDATAALFFEQKKDQITDSLWKLNVLDIESTLSRVVDRVGFWSTVQPHAVCPACKSI